MGITIHGLEQLQAELRKLPADLVREGGVVVHAHVEAAAREIVNAYPVGPTGNLRDHVRTEIRGDQFSAVGRVFSTARHAWLWENGTKGKTRHWKKNGKSTGVMPAANPRVFVPIVVQRRRMMLAALIDVVERAGLHVSGAAG
jgi:hypothetical protein